MMEIEYASLPRRTEFRGEISAVQRQRLAALRDLKRTGAHMHTWEARELALLERLNGEGPELSAAELAELAHLEYDTTLAQLGGVAPQRSMTTSTRGMTTSQRRKQLTDMRYPPTRLTPKQKIVELLRLKAEFGMSPRQRAVERLRARR